MCSESAAKRECRVSANMNTNENIDRINDLCLTELAELYLLRYSAPAKADENVTAILHIENARYQP